MLAARPTAAAAGALHATSHSPTGKSERGLFSGEAKRFWSRSESPFIWFRFPEDLQPMIFHDEKYDDEEMDLTLLGLHEFLLSQSMNTNPYRF
jgi:hypothetical protein